MVIIIYGIHALHSRNIQLIHIKQLSQSNKIIGNSSNILQKITIYYRVA
jgi:hypothetical protein